MDPSNYFEIVVNENVSDYDGDQLIISCSLDDTLSAQLLIKATVKDCHGEVLFEDECSNSVENCVDTLMAEIKTGF